MSGSAASKTTPAMASESTGSTGKQATTALLRIVIAAALMGGIFFWYAGYAQRSETLRKYRTDITELLKHDTTHDYLKAEELLDKGLAVRDSDNYFISTRAEVAAILWVEDGLEDQKAAAEKFTNQAVSEGINTGARFDAETMMLIGEDKLDEAASKLDALVQRGVTTPQIIAAVGQVHLRQGKLEQAKNDFKQVQDVFTRYAAFYGETLFLNGEIAAAQNVFTREAMTSPNHLRTRIDRARADIARGDRFAEATKAFNELYPDKGGPSEDLSPALQSRVLAGKAELQLGLDNPAAAEPYAKKAVATAWKLDPEFALAEFDLGMALALQKKPGALDQFQSAIRDFKYMPRVYFKGALALAEEGREADGAALLKAYVDNGLPTKSDAYELARGDFYVALGKSTEAEAAFDNALKVNPTNAEALYKKALIVEARAATAGPKKLDTLKQAMDLYDKALGIRQRYPEALRRLGIIYTSNGDEQHAQEKFVAALQFYTEAKVAKPVLAEFANDTLKRLQKAGPKFRSFAKEWKDETTKLLQ